MQVKHEGSPNFLVVLPTVFVRRPVVDSLNLVVALVSLEPLDLLDIVKFDLQSVLLFALALKQLERLARLVLMLEWYEALKTDLNFLVFVIRLLFFAKEIYFDAFGRCHFFELETAQ